MKESPELLKPTIEVDILNCELERLHKYLMKNNSEANDEWVKKRIEALHTALIPHWYVPRGSNIK